MLMKLKKFYLIAALMAAPAASFATDYFVTLNGGSGTKDGSSWEKALPFNTFAEKFSNYQDGDVFYFQEGTYVVSEPLKVIGKGYTIIGGFAKGLTGTTNDTPTPSATPTIFSGDINGDDVASVGDAECLLSFTVAGEHDVIDDMKVVLQGLEFTCAFSNTKGNNGWTDRGALHIAGCGSANVKDCRFHGNVANSGESGQLGGMAFSGHSSNVVFEDCEFTDNWATSRGAAIKISSGKEGKGSTVLNRCLVANNEVKEGTGSAILVQHGMAFYIINSTITDNKAGQTSGAIYSNGFANDYARNLYIVNSTIAGNEGGSQVEMAANANIYVANSIVVSDGTTGAFSFKGATHEALSGGMNILGSDVNGVFTLQDATDNAEAGNNYEKIFGDNVLGANGVIEPLADKGNYTASALDAATAGWGIEADLTVDQTGAERADGSTPGAYAKSTATGITGVEAVKGGTDDAYYTLQGVKLGSRPTATGIYIHNGKKVIIR